MPPPKDAAAALARGGVQLLSPLRASSFEEGWYDLAGAEHFWLQWRMRTLLGALRDAGLAPGDKIRALDVGGGRGVLRAQLEAQTAWTVDMADLDAPALLSRVPGRGKTLYYDVADRDPALLAAYDVVFVFDVLEHVAPTRAFVSAALAHVKPGGRIFINVPALSSCFSAFDRVVGHLRRYDRASLENELSGLAVADVDSRYWGFSLLPALVARKFLLKRHTDDKAILQAGFRPPGGPADILLRAAMRLETSWLKRPPLGTSVMLSARRTA